MENCGVKVKLKKCLKKLFKKDFIISVVISVFVFSLGFLIAVLLNSRIDSTNTQYIDLGIKRWDEIFVNNFKTTTVMFVLGLFTLSLYSLLILFINGFLLGSAISSNFSNFGLWDTVNKFIFHGFIELAGMFICSGVVLQIWISIYKSIRDKYNYFTIKFLINIFALVGASVFLLFVAAIIEGSLMPYIKGAEL